MIEKKKKDGGSKRRGFSLLLDGSIRPKYDYSQHTCHPLYRSPHVPYMV